MRQDLRHQVAPVRLGDGDLLARFLDLIVDDERATKRDE